MPSTEAGRKQQAGDDDLEDWGYNYGIGSATTLNEIALSDAEKAELALKTPIGFVRFTDKPVVKRNKRKT